MAKQNRATRKELETVIQKIIEELKSLGQGFKAIDNYLGAYVKFKGDSVAFNDYLSIEIEKMKKEMETRTETPAKGDVKSAKKSRYSKVSTPPL